MVFTTSINLDIVPLLFLFFLYSALEILITTTMADYRFIQIEEEEEFEEEIEEEEEFEDEIEEEEEFEDEIEEEEFEDEIEEEDEEREFEENLIPERIILPVNSNLLDELEDDDDDSDYDDDDDYDEEEDDGEYLIPERIILPVNIDLINRLEDDDSDYDDDDEDYEDDEDYQDDEDYEEEEMEELIPVEMTSPGRVVSSSIFSDRSVVMNNVCLDNSNDFNGRNEEVNRSEIDGLICPICFEAWTSGGEHQISCLPCGHIYGLSCINKWLQQCTSSGKCPQCNSLCTLKDVRVLYASRLCVADEELHKRVRSLEAKCAYLEQKAVLLTHDELIKQICNNPTLVERLSTAIADLNQQQVFP